MLLWLSLLFTKLRVLSIRRIGTRAGKGKEKSHGPKGRRQTQLKRKWYGKKKDKNKPKCYNCQVLDPFA